MVAEEFRFYDPALEQELYAGKVIDCSHVRCHSPLGTEVCLRHHLSVMADSVARSERWAEHRLANYRKVEDELRKEREITAGLVAGLNRATDALDAEKKRADTAASNIAAVRNMVEKQQEGLGDKYPDSAYDALESVLDYIDGLRSRT